MHIQLMNLVDWQDQSVLELAEWLQGDRSTPRPDYWNNTPSFRDNYDVPIAIADTIVIVHPEYNKGMSGELKAFLDRLSTRKFNNHQIFTIAIAAGPRGGLVPDEHLHSTLAKRGAAYSEDDRLQINFVDGFFFDDDRQPIENPTLEDRVTRFISRIANSL